MKHLDIKTTIQVAQMDELTDTEREIVHLAIDATSYSYAPYSHFHVGAGLLLKNGATFMGCNQENAAFAAGICAERSAIFAAGAKYPDQPVVLLAIAARDTQGNLTVDPVTPCGTCRQVLIETETRYKHPVRMILYGSKNIYIVNSIKQLMPLSFSEF